MKQKVLKSASGNLPFFSLYKSVFRSEASNKMHPSDLFCIEIENRSGLKSGYFPKYSHFPLSEVIGQRQDFFNSDLNESPFSLDKIEVNRGVIKGGDLRD